MSKFQKGDVVVRSKPGGRDETDADVGEYVTLVSYAPEYGEAWKVANERTKRRYYTGTAIWHEDNFEFEHIYNSPLYKALS